MLQQKQKRALAAAAALALMAAFGTAPQAARAQQVYVGSANGWDAMIAHPDQWAYVRKNADGFYVNFIQMLNPDAKKCAQTAALFARKNAYYESDSRYTGLGGFPDGGQFSRALQSQQLFALLKGGFTVPYTSLNYGVDDLKLADLKHLGLPAGVTRPCFAQNGPWTFGGGDITKNEGENARMRADTARTDGASTDGPLSLWQADQGGMRNGSFSVVKYAHSLHKTAAVMVTPYDLKPTSQWLSVAQQCVRQHEDAGAKPDIWIVFEYATSTPTLPETVNGQPADTITGMAYWLLHHVRDPKHWARISLPTASPAAPAHSETRVTTLTVHNDSPWMDLCPVVFAKQKDPHRNWNVRFRVGGQDVTQAMTQGGGLPFVGPLRLWPGQSQQVQVVISRRHPAASWSDPSAIVQIGLRPHPSAKEQINQLVTLRPAPRPSHQGRNAQVLDADRAPARPKA